MWAIESRAYPLGQLMGGERAPDLHHPALAVCPLGLYRVQPRALLRQVAAYDPYALLPSLLHLPVVLADPPPNLLAHVPRGVVPYQDPSLLARLSELLRAPRKEACGYAAHGTAVLEAQHPPGVLLGQAHQPVAAPFFLSYSGSGLVIQRLARSQRTPSLESVARTVSPVTRFSVSPSSKLTSAASSKVHRLVGLPKLRGVRCSSSLRRSARSGSKAAWMVSGREEPLLSASSMSPSPKAWMALRTVWSLQPKGRAIREARSPLALASRIWQRRRTKASEERRPSSRAIRSSSSSGRTKMDSLMVLRLAPHLPPPLRKH